MRIERAIGIGLLVFCAVAGFLTTHLSESTMEGEPGPKFFPALVILLLTVLSLILTISSRGPSEPVVKKDDIFSTREALAYFAVFLFGLAAMYFTGFYISIGVTLAVMTCLSHWKVAKSIVFSIIVMLVVYLLFDRLLEIPMPVGAFFR